MHLIIDDLSLCIYFKFLVLKVLKRVPFFCRPYGFKDGGGGGELMNRSLGVAQTSVFFPAVMPYDIFIASQPFHRNTVVVGDARNGR